MLSFGVSQDKWLTLKESGLVTQPYRLGLEKKPKKVKVSLYNVHKSDPSLNCVCGSDHNKVQINDQIIEDNWFWGQ